MVMTVRVRVHLRSRGVPGRRRRRPPTRTYCRDTFHGNKSHNPTAIPPPPPLLLLLLSQVAELRVPHPLRRHRRLRHRSLRRYNENNNEGPNVIIRLRPCPIRVLTRVRRDDEHHHLVLRMRMPRNKHRRHA